MSASPSMPLFLDAYLADTTHLTTEEHGAYLLLLMAMWRRNGSVPDDDRDLARIVGQPPRKWALIKERLLPLLVARDGELSQKRLKKEWDFVQRKRAAAAANGARGGRPRANENKNLAKANGSFSLNPNESSHTHTHKEKEPNGSLSETSSDPKPKKARKKRVSYPPDFEAAWLEYPTDPNMSKADAFDAYAKLDAADKDALAASIRPFVAYCRAHPDYRPKHMVGFIKSRRFDGFQPQRTSPTDGDERWRKRLLFARQRRVWSTPEWGPPPGADGCLVPPHLLAPEDGAGWGEFERERA